MLVERREADARKALEQSLQISPTYAPAVELLVNLDLATSSMRLPLIACSRLSKRIRVPRRLSASEAKSIWRRPIGLARKSDLIKAIELDPNLQPAYLLLAQLYIASNRHDQAIAKLNEAIEKN